MTNDEYLKELVQRGDGSLAAWFASEHVETQNGTLDGARDTADAISGDDAVDDSREKLEDDMAGMLQSAYMLAWQHGYEDRRGGSFKKLHGEFYHLLDRQAEITERQYEERVANIEHQIGAIKAANDDYREEVDRLQRRNDELRTSYDKLKREHDNLADDLLTCNREREQLREHLGIALDHAHDICSLVDIDGNVLDVGD